VSACAAGLTFDLYRPALSALTTDVVPEPAQRKKALAVLYLTLNVGRGAACIIGGIVASHAFWPLFAANATINVIFGIAVYHCVRPDRRRPTDAPVRLGVALRDRRLLVFTCITLVFYTIHMQSVIALPLVIAEHGAKPLQFGLLLALDPLIVAAVQLAIQHKLLSTKALHACAAGVAMVGVGLAVAGAGNGIGWYAATMPLWIAGEVVFLAVAQDVVASLAPPQRMASYFGLWGLSQGLAALLAPIVATVLIGLGGTGLLWGAGAVIGVAAALACLALQRSQQRRNATRRPTAKLNAGPSISDGLPFVLMSNSPRSPGAPSTARSAARPTAKRLRRVPS
jgi:dipeptide/tripeptide permease